MIAEEDLGQFDSGRRVAETSTLLRSLRVPVASLGPAGRRLDDPRVIGVGRSLDQRVAGGTVYLVEEVRIAGSAGAQEVGEQFKRGVPRILRRLGT